MTLERPLGRPTKVAPDPSDPLGGAPKSIRNHRPRGDLPRATHRGRRISHPLGATSQSDTRGRSRLYGETTRFKPGATSRSDPPRSLPKARRPLGSDMPRSLRVYCWVDFYFT
ncbi:unnamed protein product [Brassica napus]|uniref:(rape) hypothetical protein n=1 Tax=Brassica napus TaxID=3708 RepID=A0A816JTP6_BRANA|nr:unnamed protein product [Brassica napus]